MESIILSMIVLLVGILQSPQVPLEQKQKILDQTLPVISRYMEENKNVVIQAESIPEDIKMEDGAVEAEKENRSNKINIIIPKAF